MIYLDCETCGFHGLPVTLQYAEDDGPIVIHELWRSPIGESLELIRRICKQTVCGFNLAFDWFHLQKVYNVFDRFGDEDAYPEEHIEGIAEVEMDARDGMCVKPESALDMMLHFRKTELQITMQRDDMRIRKVPKAIAQKLADVLSERVQLDPLLFAAQKKWAPRFVVEPIKLDDDTTHPTLRNVVLRFRPGGSLKALATHLLGEEVVQFTAIEVHKKFRPKEYGYAPFARSVGRPGKWNWSWPDVIQYHIRHWGNNEGARRYAESDVVYTRQLHEYAGKPVGGDTDSVLACLVASCRWKGYKIDMPKLRSLVESNKARLRVCIECNVAMTNEGCPKCKGERSRKTPQSPNQVKDWINPLLSPLEQTMAWRNGTDKRALKNIIEVWSEEKPEVAERAKTILAARKSKKKNEVLEKLLLAERFHAAFKVIGALSGRMSGDNKLNAQGIDKTKEVRGCFPLAFDGEVLMGGDMKSFEISIAAADYHDPKLGEQLTTCDTHNTLCIVEHGNIVCHKCIEEYTDPKYEKRCPKCGLGLVVNEKNETRCNRCFGAECKSFHALFGAGFFPELGYDGIMASKGTANDVYNSSKIGGFSTLYGAQPAKLASGMGVSDEAAVEGFHAFWRTYSMAGKKRRETENAFTSLYGSPKIKYKKPEDAIESLLGYKRYFVLENYLIKELFELANNLPEAWKKLKGKVTRNEKKGEQRLANAITSAIYGCAFSVQNSCIRQAANHRIQSTGAGITKEIQVTVWQLQPSGVHPWIVRPMNIHDEIQCPSSPECIEELERLVRSRVEDFRPLIPLIGIDFGKLNAWSDK